MLKNNSIYLILLTQACAEANRAPIERAEEELDACHR